MSKRELDAILKESLSWNKEHGISGMLLYIKSDLLHHKEGRFIQALEGNETDVRQIFSSIMKDKRHFNICILTETHLREKNFSEWSMGFKSIDAMEYLNTPGRFELNEDFLKLKSINSLNPALDFLKQFYSLNVSSNYTK